MAESTYALWAKEKIIYQQIYEKIKEFLSFGS